MREKDTTLEELSTVAGKSAGLAQNVIKEFINEKIEGDEWTTDLMKKTQFDYDVLSSMIDENYENSNYECAADLVQYAKESIEKYKIHP